MNTKNIEDDELTRAAHMFLTDAWTELERQRVVPRPRHSPYVRVGRDYEGTTLMSLDTYHPLVEAIEQTHPRFQATGPGEELDRVFGSSYVFGFLETYIARVTRSGINQGGEGSAAEQTVRELAAEVHANTFEVACCRAVSHLTTASREPLTFDGVDVVPVIATAGRHRATLATIIDTCIPFAASAFDTAAREAGYAPPESVIVARERGPKPFDLAEPLSQRIQQFLLLTRLLHSGTGESLFEIQGETSPVRMFDPVIVQFRGAGPGLGSPTQFAERPIWLTDDDPDRVDGLRRLLAAANPKRPDMTITSFGMAMHKFTLSYHAYVWYEQLVDLATAFEAALAGTSHSDVLLRLGLRASALLWTDRDPADAIFTDIRGLYDLRSTLVHGGELKAASLMTKVRKLSTVPEGEPDGVAVAYAVERLRDLVRRALLARICLATPATSGAAPLWPIGGGDKVDARVDVALIGDASRMAWRRQWREVMDSIGALASADRPELTPPRQGSNA